MEKQLTCTLCPQGCQLGVQYDEGTEQLGAVEGNRCARGVGYVREEVLHPTRLLTTTVRVEGGMYPVLPVRTARPIPKGRIWAAMEVVRRLVVQAPVESGQVLVEDLAGSGVALVASRFICIINSRI